MNSPITGWSDPINCIIWQDARHLSPCDYNPNHVMTPELELLERNILKHGWTQPILATEAGIIIDGFHRWRLARESKSMIDKYHYMIPCSLLDLAIDQAMILTVRMNRAKGTHAAFRMSILVRSLMSDYGYDTQMIMTELAMTKGEVDLLSKDLFTHKRLESHQYSKSWVPADVAIPTEEEE